MLSSCSLQYYFTNRVEPVFNTGCQSERRRQWQRTPVLLPGKSHGRRSLVGCGPWDRKELDSTQQLHFHFSLSWIRKGNDNPLQCSFLPGESQGRGSLVGYRLCGCTELYMTVATQQQQQLRCFKPVAANKMVVEALLLSRSLRE